MSRRKIAIIHIGGRNGQVVDLIVRENDDPMVLAKTFLQDQQLPAKLLPLILQKIAESVLEATRKQMSQPSASAVRSSEREEEEEYERARNSALSSAVDDLKRRTMPTKQLSSASSFSLGIGGGGGSRPRSSSAGSPTSRSRGQQQQEATAEQMLQVVNRYDRHKEELKRKLERDQEESLARADFRSHLRASPSRWRAHVSHARNSNRGDDPFDGLYRLHEDQTARKRLMKIRAERERLAKEQESCRPLPTLQTSSTMRPAPSPSPNAVFDGLYSWAAVHRNRRQKAQIDHERTTSPSFSPTICRNSAVLAQRRNERRSQGGLNRTHAPQLPDLAFHDDLGVNHDVVALLRGGDEHLTASSSNSTIAVATTNMFTPYSALMIRSPLTEEEGDRDGDEDLNYPPGAVSPLSDNTNAFLFNHPSTPPPTSRTPGNMQDFHIPFHLDSEYRSSGSNPVAANVFDRLYYCDKEEKEQHLQHLAAEHHPECTYQPDIGKSSKRPVEKDADLFYQRLHGHHSKQLYEQAQRKIEIEKEILNKANSLGGNRRLSAQQSQLVVERLYRKQERVEQKIHNNSQNIQQKVQQMQSQRYTLRKSEMLTLRRQIESLGEIFDVLLVTVQFRKDVNPKEKKSSQPQRGDENDINQLGTPLISSQTCDGEEEVKEDVEESPIDGIGEQMTLEEIIDRTMQGWAPLPEATPPPPDSIPQYSSPSKVVPATDFISLATSLSPNRPVTQSVPASLPCPPHPAGISTEDLLDTNEADAELLKPAPLQKTIQAALDLMKPLKVSKKQFIQTILQLMEKRKLAPLNYLLVPPDKRRDRKIANASYLSSNQRDDLACTFKPKLEAEKSTLAKIQDRYKDRLQGKEAATHSLYAYREYYEERKKENEEKWKAYELAECTFQPRSMAKYMKEAKESVEHIRRSRSVDPSRGEGRRAAVEANQPPSSIVVAPVPTRAPIGKERWQGISMERMQDFIQQQQEELARLKAFAARGSIRS
eukprot:scaffold1537_cov162-Ochromonas_danica.AAC.23